MRKALISFGVAAVVLFVAYHGMASEPAITGRLEGLELCAQSQCGAAYFIGKFTGKVDKKTARGGFIVSINHDTLPGRRQAATITAGEWTLRTNLGLFSGEVLSGTIFNNGDDTFAVQAVLQLTSEGRGRINVKGELDHDDFPPTVSARLSQPSSE